MERIRLDEVKELLVQGYSCRQVADLAGCRAREVEDLAATGGRVAGLPTPPTIHAWSLPQMCPKCRVKVYMPCYKCAMETYLATNTVPPAQEVA